MYGHSMIRLVVGAAGALSLMTGMFALLWHLVDLPLEAVEAGRAIRIDFSRTRRDTEVVSRRPEKIEREPPPQATPALPRMTVASAETVRSAVPWSPDVGDRNAIAGIGLTAGSDQDVLPLVRIPPDYPPRATARGIEGWVLVQFTITETGAVRDAHVVTAEPEGIFEQAALQAIARWRYNPRVVDGVAVERVGVRTMIQFVLEE